MIDQQCDDGDGTVMIYGDGHRGSIGEKIGGKREVLNWGYPGKREVLNLQMFAPPDGPGGRAGGYLAG